MLNPSTADADDDDPTIRRCMAFARREGAGGIIVGNLLAFRATDPKSMIRATDPFGPENCNALADIAGGAIASGQPVVCAWGVHGTFRDADKISMKQMAPARLVCLGTTKDGHPRHPLYVKGDQPLVGFPNAR